MVNYKELVFRIKEFFRFNRQELTGLAAAIIVTAIIFSFRDWGEESFNLTLGLVHLLTVAVVILISFFFRISCQKVYALNSGYKAEFKVWWVGLVIALVLSFVSMGYVPLILVGSMVASLMVRQRLGEFRYGFSYKQNALISLWGIFGNLMLAGLFALGLFALPENYFFYKGLTLNLIMAFCSLIPLPQLDGLSIFFGSRGWYFTALISVLLASALLLSQTKLGLIIAIVLGAIAGIIAIITGSEI